MQISIAMVINLNPREKDAYFNNKYCYTRQLKKKKHIHKISILINSRAPTPSSSSFTAECYAIFEA